MYRYRYLLLFLVLPIAVCADAVQKLPSADAGPINRVTALCYHRIADDSKDIYTLTKKQFEEQLRYLRDNGFHGLSLAEFAAWKAHKTRIPDKSVLITFDDGVESIYTVALPLLSKYHYRANLFLISDRIGAPGYLNKEQIGELLQKGFGIGSHSATHRSIVGKGLGDSIKELVSSMKTLEQTFHRKVDFFAYPFGYFDEPSKTLTRLAGYKGALSIIPGTIEQDDDMYELKRVMLNNTLKLHHFQRLVRGDRGMLTKIWKREYPIYLGKGLSHIAGIERDAIRGE